MKRGWSDDERPAGPQSVTRQEVVRLPAGRLEHRQPTHASPRVDVRLDIADHPAAGDGAQSDGARAMPVEHATPTQQALEHGQDVVRTDAWRVADLHHPLVDVGHRAHGDGCAVEGRGTTPSPDEEL